MWDDNILEGKTLKTKNITGYLLHIKNKMVSKYVLSAKHI